MYSQELNVSIRSSIKNNLEVLVNRQKITYNTYICITRHYIYKICFQISI